jgi:hypothetical protein
MLYIARVSFRPAKDLCDLMSRKACSREALEVSVGKASRTASGFADRMVEMEDAIESGRRALDCVLVYSAVRGLNEEVLAYCVGSRADENCET